MRHFLIVLAILLAVLTLIFYFYNIVIAFFEHECEYDNKNREINTKVIDGKQTSSKIKESIKKEITDNGYTPKLACIIVGENPASQVYVRNKEKACATCGIESKIIRLPETITEEDLIVEVNNLNNDDSVDGFIVQLPLPKHINEQHIIDAIDPSKDVDGFTPINLGKLMIGEDCFIPATPLGIITLLKEYDIETNGKNVVIVGRSNIVGKPIANLLMQKGYDANVTVAHSKTTSTDLFNMIENADIIIAACGVPEMINHCKPGAIIIDVGINRLDDGSLCGDVDYKEVIYCCGGITPVPGGVGPMTVCSLMMNTLKAYKNRH